MTDERDRSGARYEAAKAALKQGINILVQEQPSQRVTGECSPKDLRTCALIESIEITALVDLLIAKEVIDSREYFEYLAEHAEKEVAILQERLTKMMGGRKVTLK